MKLMRKIIAIDEAKCTGCGICAESCPEGALQVVDGQARLVGDLLCDGLGACLKCCPEDAISIEERDAEPYNEIEAIKNIVPQGPNVILAHLHHLESHGQAEYFRTAVAYLREHGIPVPLPERAAASTAGHAQGGCPGSRMQSFGPKPPLNSEPVEGTESQLTHWPIQLHLLSPLAPCYRGADLLIAADCVAYSLAGFHSRFLAGRTLAIACPKLDSGQDAYLEKLIALIDQAEVKSVRVMIMQVPCCSGLLRLVTEAARRASRKPPISCVVVSLQGDILQDRPVEA